MTKNGKILIGVLKQAKYINCAVKRNGDLITRVYNYGKKIVVRTYLLKTGIDKTF